MATVRFVATLARERRKDLDLIARELTAAGLAVDQKLAALGLLSGTAPQGALERLRSVDGVAHVREEHTFSLPPFDEDTPQ